MLLNILDLFGYIASAIYVRQLKINLAKGDLFVSKFGSERVNEKQDKIWIHENIL